MMDPLIRIQEPRPAAGARHFALFDLGFRPFYLVASAFAALSIALWALQFVGWLGGAYLQGPMWHAHEMLFGFTQAVIVGFLFTAGRNWSGRPTPTGAPLAALVALWVAGRLLVLTPYGWAAAVVNVAFPLVSAVMLGIPFFAARNKRNYFFVGLLVVMGLASLGMHLAHLGVLTLPGWVGIQIALDVVLFIMAVMGGRVIPMFTNNGIPGAGAVRQPLVEKAALGSALALLAADALQLRGLPLVVLLVACALAHGLRLGLWRPWTTLRTPLVWVLHLAYAWIVLYFVLRAAAELGWGTASAATHALTVGGIGGLVIGMMTRTARGHTGRLLKAGRAEVVTYALVALAALVRVAVPLAAPTWMVEAIVGSAALWSAAFALYVVSYWPILSRPRIDGLPG